jgi:hypothetical protein
MAKPSKATEAKPPMVTTTISLPEPDLITLQHLAVERRTTVRDLVREALTDLLKQARKQKGSTK